MAEISLDSQSYTFTGLESKYGNFLVPGFEVMLEGTDLVKQGVSVTDIKVDTSVDKADTFSFTVNNAFDVGNRTFKWDNYFKVGKYLKINMGYVDKLSPVFDGLVTSVRFEINADDSPKVTVSGMDRTFLLMKGTKSRSFDKKKHSDIVTSIASEHGLSVGTVDDTGVQHEIVEQSRVTDYQFIAWMAWENNHEFFIAGKKLYFRKPHANKTPSITLEWGQKYLRSLMIEADIADQVAGVVVKGWNMSEKKEITANAGSIDKLGDGSTTGQSVISTLCGSEAKEYVYDSVLPQDAAQKKATALLNRRAMKLVSGNGECVGIPMLRAGNYIKVDKFGSNLNSTYYLTEVSHTINDAGYYTAFTLGGNAI